jgi:hypothetical protein
MTDGELLEKMAQDEHERWARWQTWLHSLCTRNADGSLTIRPRFVTHWEKRIATHYAELPEIAKQADREEVAHLLPIIRAYVAQFPGVPTGRPMFDPISDPQEM